MKIRIQLDRQAAVLKEKGREWQEKIAWMDSLESAQAHPPVSTPQEFTPAKRPDKTPIQNDSTPVPSTRKEDICLISCAGETFALPAAGIVKIDWVCAKKAARILIRGHASLADFKKVFRNIKTGVLDRWAKMPTKEIKAYRFEPFNRELVRHTVTDGCTAVLASDGRRHAVIFATEAWFVQRVPIRTTENTEDILGTFNAEDGRQVNLYAFKHLACGFPRLQPVPPNANIVSPE